MLIISYRLAPPRETGPVHETMPFNLVKIRLCYYSMQIKSNTHNKWKIMGTADLRCSHVAVLSPVQMALWRCVVKLLVSKFNTTLNKTGAMPLYLINTLFKILQVSYTCQYLILTTMIGFNCHLVASLLHSDLQY